MSARKTPTKSRKSTQQGKSAPTSDRVSVSASTVYKDFTLYRGTKSPTWHPIKKMRYVFFRMIHGVTITDAIAEIHWSAAEFWHLVDLERHAPFREEYTRAKKLQGRAIADSILAIAEGRDRTSRKTRKAQQELITKAMHRVKKSKSALQSKLILESLMAGLRESEKGIVNRNKLQIDGAKWIAAKVNPAEFSDASKLSLGAPAGDGSDTPQPILIQFIGKNGKAVDL